MSVHRANRSRPRGWVVPALVVLLAVASWSPAVAEEPPAPVNVTAPSLSGTARWAETMTADPGTWEPADTALTYQWLRDGVPVAGAIGPTYRIAAAGDIGKGLSVQVAPEGHPDAAVESSRQVVERIVIRNLKAPSLRGTPRYGKTPTLSTGTWSARALHYRYQWFSAGKPVKGATAKSFKLRPGDVGHTVRVEVTVLRAGHTTVTKTSTSWIIKHVTDRRRTVTYSVSTRGKVTQSLSTFKRQAQETFDDPRGWRSNGIAFKRVTKGGDFTLVLSQASQVPTFSSACSSRWSCRVGRYVVINQDRWRSASPAWRDKKGTIRDYRHMVVNHETGHWLGKGHVGCSAKGSMARVMQQQSKGLGGCRFNPWPTKSERYAPRFSF